eukprot:2831331-Prymnesium_polylepis.1
MYSSTHGLRVATVSRCDSVVSSPNASAASSGRLHYQCRACLHMMCKQRTHESQAVSAAQQGTVWSQRGGGSQSAVSASKRVRVGRRVMQTSTSTRIAYSYARRARNQSIDMKWHWRGPSTQRSGLKSSK